MRPVLLCVVFVCGSAIPASAQQFKEITNSIGMKLVLIHRGSFTMGSPEEMLRSKDDPYRATPHEVVISKDFYLGVFEVTQAQFERLTTKNPSGFRAIDHPVETVSWDAALAFLEKLSELPAEKAAHRVYRLPTEAEWEYACRASSGAAFCFGDSAEWLEEYAWFGDEAGSTHPIGSKKPNRWGLHDMHGNVAEWCDDQYGSYPSGEAIDPMGPRDRLTQVIRGGSWNRGSEFCRSDRRQYLSGSLRYNQIGFRVAMSLPAKQPESTSSK